MSGNDELLTLVSDLVVGIDQFELDLGRVGASSFGEFHEALDKRTGTKVVMKIYDTPSSDSGRIQLMREIKFHAEKHPLIVELVGYGLLPDDGNTRVFMAFKPAPYVTLHNALRMEKQGTAVAGWDATSKSKCVFGIAAAMCVVHSRNYLHRHLTSTAVQLDEHLEPVLGEFDLARECGTDMTMAIGVPLHMAPELWGDDNRYDNKVDVFAFAVLLHCIFSDDGATRLDDDEKPPRSPPQFMERVGKGARLTRIEGIPDFYWDLITSCWDQDPKKRPSFQEIVGLLHENTEKYIFPGADLAAVKEYESRVMATIPQGQ